MADSNEFDNSNTDVRRCNFDGQKKSSSLFRMSTTYCPSRMESVDNEIPPNPNLDTKRNFKDFNPINYHTENYKLDKPKHEAKHSNFSSAGGANKHLPQTLMNWNIPSRYELKRLIGSGSYGQVCKAYDSLEKKYVAIKRIHKVFYDLVDCKRILREIAILNRLNHPNIVNILDIIMPSNLETFDELYVVLEIADSDFKRLLHSSAFLNESHIRTLTYNLLVGTQYLHNVGIYHRDLKPANCLVNKDCSVKICDFGLARALSSKGYTLYNTNNGDDNQPHSVDNHAQPQSKPDKNNAQTKNFKKQLTSHVVTRWYRAPEIILLQEEYTQAIDVWSIGCIFAELMSMIKGNVNSPNDRAPLFPGLSCFPLSPDNRNDKKDDKQMSKINKLELDDCNNNQRDKDQLNMIFNILGTPWEDDVECFEKEYVKKYIRMFPPRTGIDLTEKYKNSSSEAVDLLKHMLVFKPENRVTIAQALAHPFFDSIRNNRNVNVTNPCETAGEGPNALKKIYLPFNDSMDMTESELRREFLLEIKRFHPELVIPPSLENMNVQ